MASAASEAATTEIPGPLLAQALLSGIYRVIGEQEELNRINVFPVPDGDTGTNLSLSLGAAIGVLESPADPHTGRLLAATADALLDGARGNSGAIVAQFFQGVSDAASDLERFTTESFGEAIARGSDYAHDALSNPREGTILTVIAAFAAAVRERPTAPGPGFAAVLDHGRRKAEAALAATTDQLEVLRKAGVVDAGAKGFAALVAGMAEFIVEGRQIEAPDGPLAGDVHVVTVAGGEDSAFRYCTECVVSGADIDRRKLREALADAGDSLVLAGTKQKARIHVHVNEPGRVFEIARRYGKVSAEKIDDMQRQQATGRDAARRFAVITDSAADIPDSEIERLDIHVVPCRVQFGERGYLDKVSITSREFFEELSRNPVHPTTSQPAPGDFRRQFEFLASHFPDVLSINLTGRVSGTLEAARSAAARTRAHGRVHVVDSRNASLGQGLIATYAAECALAGLDVETTLEGVRALIADTRSYGLLKDLRYAVRGGRVPGWVKKVADLARLTAIIRTVPDGRVASGLFLFGRQRLPERFARYVARRTEAGPLCLAVAHATSPEDAKLLHDTLLELLPDVRSSFVTDVGAALGVHGGPGTLIVATQPWREPPAPG